MKKVLAISFLLTLLFLTACSVQQKNQIVTKTSQKNVVMIMIDSMTEELIETSIKTGEFPALSFLIKNGQNYGDLVAPFPSMSVSIEGSLITGKMPNQHNIPGLTWYNVDENILINYGTSIETIYKLGFKETLENTFYHLNNTHLNNEITTIFEELQDKGISTGAVNTLLFRGRTKHELELPSIVQSITGSPERIKTQGPDLLTFGNFYRPVELKNQYLPDTLIQKAGFTDNYASAVISKLMLTNQQPQFLLAFFPEMDKKTHRNGPPDVEGFKKVEKELQHILNVYQDWDQALNDNIFILFGDHGQDRLEADKDVVKINLHQLYNQFEIAPYTDQPLSGDIVIANNHRMAFVHPINKQIQKEKLVDIALQDNRIALSSILHNDWIHVWNSDNQFLRFKKGGEWTDSYNQSWSIEGNYDVLKLKVNEQEKTLAFTEYPDALNQLHSASYSQPHAMIVTAKPGYIIYSETTPVNDGGGEHGGMHKIDTHAAIIIAGTDKQLKHRRIVDLKNYVLSLF